MNKKFRRITTAATMFGAIAASPAFAQDGFEITQAELDTAHAITADCDFAADTGYVTLDCVKAVRDETMAVASAYRAGLNHDAVDWNEDPARAACVEALGMYPDNINNNVSMSGGQVIHISRATADCAKALESGMKLGYSSANIGARQLDTIWQAAVCNDWKIGGFKTGEISCALINSELRTLPKLANAM